MKDIKDMNLAEAIEALRDVDVITRGYQCNYDAIEELADRIQELTSPHIVKEEVCTSCLSLEISDVNCMCVTEKYETVELEFQKCPLCHHINDDYLETPFNNEQLKDYPKWEDLE
jgi:hypothetical protein